jgi:hypothetical protein
MITDCPDCAIRWSCSLEADGPEFKPCPKHTLPPDHDVKTCDDLCPEHGHIWRALSTH